MICGPCEGTGFVNLDQISEDVLAPMRESGDFCQAVLAWIASHEDHDVAVCGCCGDNSGSWDGEPGEHDEERFGPGGPYAYNGGLPECF